MNKQPLKVLKQEGNLLTVKSVLGISNGDPITMEDGVLYASTAVVPHEPRFARLGRSVKWPIRKVNGYRVKRQMVRAMEAAMKHNL